jgi:translation elongation factor P/translation initiation factor 5A
MDLKKESQRIVKVVTKVLKDEQKKQQTHKSTKQVERPAVTLVSEGV